ncbi:MULTISPECIES: heavy metal translocating P-type ATPase [Oceanobacillus]|uniref:heavy metal translocating P-type ATPase n=1 Tax=Oceanobacillus TaxID=182709 RepID=UPI002115D631|nr:heavy metal translocating P-type ATPase [Oceanobacillus oncorhynchi]MDM8101674.1 heavy metal translocating P-type ATPase [Oceanobacillus oncorhynchi]UUI41329.1 heavy metal translocating P-type ATPase [Oceanobacillus oncorhynchi]
MTGTNSSGTFLLYLKIHGEIIAAAISGILILTAWILSGHISHALWITLLIAAFLIGGFAKAKEGITETYKTKKLNVELLMIIAAIGAASIGYWAEGAILIFIFSLSGALESYTENKNKNELKSLMKLQPESATLLNGEIISISELKPGDCITVKSGERIPADGIIVKGDTTVDESALSGESIPITKTVSDEAYAGTVNLGSSLQIEINTLPTETMFQKIIELVQDAHEERSPSQQFIEKFEGVYVNVVLVTVAVMMFLPHFLFGWSWTDTIYRAMILLVVASPCALVASIMPATLSAISNGARQGILFKGGVYVEALAKLDAVAFDKTGTLTKGEPAVVDYFIKQGENSESLANVIYTMESESIHPLAQAMKQWASVSRGGLRELSAAVKHHNGKGLSAELDGVSWWIGNAELVGKQDADQFLQVFTPQEQATTNIFVRKDAEIIAVFLLKDTLRQDAVEAIQELNKLGLRTIMLTGDNQATAASIAQEAGITEFHANCLPEDKVNYLKQLRAHNQQTAMIGDGVNDAPALATANIGVAMGAGSDIALETANVVLMKNNLAKMVNAIRISKKMNAIVKQNIIFSLAIIAILIASNFLQIINMPLGVIGHEGSTILVILNGLRMLKGE